MNYDAIINILEIEVKTADAAIIQAKLNGDDEEVKKLHANKFTLLEQLRKYRVLQYESQFDIMSDDDDRY
jgi:hypothetical protein